jgi:hypothetical protein
MIPIYRRVRVRATFSCDVEVALKLFFASSVNLPQRRLCIGKVLP